MGSPKKIASGLTAACLRSSTDTRPKSSEVAPYSCAYRWAMIATRCAGVVMPNGRYQAVRPALPARGLRSAEPRRLPLRPLIER
jgi:hypothetical protein